MKRGISGFRDSPSLLHTGCCHPILCKKGEQPPVLGTLVQVGIKIFIVNLPCDYFHRKVNRNMGF